MALLGFINGNSSLLVELSPEAGETALSGISPDPSRWPRYFLEKQRK